MTRKTFLIASALAALSATIAVPAVSAAPTVKARVVDGTLRVTGSPFADQIALRISKTDPNQLQVDTNADGTADDTFDTNSFASIVVASKATDGADSPGNHAPSSAPMRKLSPVDAP